MHLRRSLSAILLLSCAVPALNASGPDRREYLQSQVDMLVGACKQYIVGTAKDPSSVQFPSNYNYGFGHGLTRNWVLINIDAMGRNTFGAVLRHSMTCTYTCNQSKGCKLVSFTDN